MTNAESLPSRMTALCSNLALGIHAAAQPLAVLEAGLSKEHTHSMSRNELRHLVTSSAAEVRRVSILFHCMQQLVMAQSEPPLAPTPIVPLLAEAIDGVQLLFDNDGISLIAQLPASPLLVRIHPSRTLHALSRILLVAHALSQKGQPVELLAAHSNSAVQITIRNNNALPANVSSEIRLSLAVAAANIHSQHAAYSQDLQPFAVHIELPQASFDY
jgi:signal transduction histidine kinase